MNICVTGASRGLGKALTGVLLAQGHRVWGVGRGSAPGFDGGRGTFTWSICDIADASSLAAWVRSMEAAGFIPDALVLNAAIQLDDLGRTFDALAARTTINVNLTAALACIGSILPTFQRTGRGQFIAVTSVMRLRPSNRSAGYAASKAGLSIALRSLRLWYGTPSIRFREVCLGPIATEMWEGRPSRLVPPAPKAAEAIAAFLGTRQDILYYPLLTTLLLRLSLPLPDRVFAALSRRFLH